MYNKQVVTMAQFQLTSTMYTVILEHSVIFVGANDNIPALLTNWNNEIQSLALKALGKVNDFTIQ